MPVILFFIVLPFLEFMIFGFVSSRIGAWNAIGLLGFNTLVGIAILQNQGFKTLQNLHGFRHPRTPLETPLGQLCTTMAGLLLILPGFITDVMGYALLIPFTRRLLKYLLVAQGGWAIYEHHSTTQNGDIIEGEYERVEKETAIEIRDKTP